MSWLLGGKLFVGIGAYGGEDFDFDFEVEVDFGSAEDGEDLRILPFSTSRPRSNASPGQHASPTRWIGVRQSLSPGVTVMGLLGLQFSFPSFLGVCEWHDGCFLDRETVSLGQTAHS